MDGVVDLLWSEPRRRIGTPCRRRMVLTVRRSTPKRSPKARIDAPEVARDQLLDLAIVELPSTPGPSGFGRR
ncbi:hypothetical protein [Amycolatopsis sp. H20-H5]|uniref:hypothetical protein n=1 Tax=Amycolatopsis sp. H20-H5 TaxID=3046309 RepID=UPI002DBD31A2|nr:hypothetical protein [Amycolatopsis sp. H20-H5]MEC3975799.1 hypothetical protein [Amycolatopsis sp. H20-H5]